MRQRDRSPRHCRLVRAVVVVLTFVAVGCGKGAETDYPPVSGQRVQAASVAAEGPVPYRVGAYELVFPAVLGEVEHARRAALLVDLVQGHGNARGFVEWRKSDGLPRTYAVEGWARQRGVEGELVTVFELVTVAELALTHVNGADTRRPSWDSGVSRPAAVRVVVHETSGTATLIQRR